MPTPNADAAARAGLLTLHAVTPAAVATVVAVSAAAADGRCVRRLGSCGGVYLIDIMERLGLAARVAHALVLCRE
jgi:hypothetical protein